MIIGAVLLSVELFAVDAQFYLVFLGLSAVMVGLAEFFGVNLPEWGQWLAFAILALIFFFTFRKALYKKIHGSVEGFRDSLDGDTLLINEDLEPGAETRAEHRGTNWTVRNTGNTVIKSGSRVPVVKVDGLTLHVAAE